jgi:ATP phosphoribosyltransferase
VSSKFVKLDPPPGGDLRSRLVFGIPKKGRLFEKVDKILAGSGIEYTRQARLDIAHCTDLPITLVFLPASDIPTYVGEGDVDLGITGEDMVAECGVDVNVLMQLGFGKCNLSVQGPKDLKLKPEDLAGKRIVTSFPTVTRKYFEPFELGKQTQIKCISGSVEAAIGLGLADGIVDLVETGTTMRAAGLEEVSVVMKSQAVLIANPHTKHRDLVDIIRKRLDGYLVAQSWVMVTYNVHRMNLKAAEAVTPGKRSPSIQSLEEPNWVAVSALVPKGRAAETMDRLEAVGARDILLTGLMSTRLG